MSGISPTLGELFDGRFRLLDIVGQGNSSIVYRARQEIAGTPLRDVAIKVLRNTDVPRNTVAELRRMIDLAREMQSHTEPKLAQHVVHIIDGGLVEDDSTLPYVVMELVAGGNLRDLLQRHGNQPVSPAKTVAWLRQLLLPLQWLHSQNPSVPYGDLHPGNILVSATGDLKLTDFGRSLRVPSAMSFWGAVEYQAPEQLNGSAPSVSSDIYAVGLLWYELLFGHSPFQDYRLMELGRRLREMRERSEHGKSSQKQEYDSRLHEYIGEHVRARRLLDNAALSSNELFRNHAECADLLSRCLSYQPSKRPRDASTLLDELSRLEPRKQPNELTELLPVGPSLLENSSPVSLIYPTDIDSTTANPTKANLTYPNLLNYADSLNDVGLSPSARSPDFVSAVSRVAQMDESAQESSQQWEPLPESRGSSVPRGLVDRVHFTATSPLEVCPGAEFVLDIWAHLEQQREQVLELARQQSGLTEMQSRTKGPVVIARQSVLTIRLSIAGLEIDDPEDNLYWEGAIGNASFLVSVPETAAPGPRSAKATVHVNGAQVAKLYFSVTVGNSTAPASELPLQEQRHRSAFASYASADRDEVLSVIQGIQKVLPHLDIYLDVARLRSGQRWEEELARIVPSRDVFYLFWSTAASQSEWVDREWRCAFEQRGLDYIDPIPIISPEIVPPPRELANLHFNDWLLAFKSHQARVHTSPD